MLNIKSLIGFVFLSCFALQAIALDKAHVQVTGHGSIEAMPDFVRLQITIEQTSKDKAQIKNQVDQITQQVIQAAKKLNIKDTNIEAAELAIYPEYDWVKSQRVYKGHTVSRSVNIKLHNLAAYSELADALADINITRFQQQGYGFDHPEQLQNQALINALNNAKQTAQLIAQTYDRSLGKAYSITEAGRNMPMPRPMMMSRAADSSVIEAAPLKVQAQTINANVNVIFLLK